jgi:hypothetical protein
VCTRVHDLKVEAEMFTATVCNQSGFRLRYRQGRCLRHERMVQASSARIALTADSRLVELIHFA